MDSERLVVTVADVSDEEGPAETPMRDPMREFSNRVGSSPAVQQHLTRGG